MSLLSAHDLTKRYGDRTVLGGISVTLEPRDRLGLIGINGTGKSTLVRILTGRETPDGGEIQRKRGLTVHAVDQVPALDPESTVGDAVLTGLARHRAVRAELERIETEMAGASGEALEALVHAQAEHLEQLDRLGGYDLSHEADALLDALRAPPKDRRLGSCSLGEQRRVGLAVGLLAAPDVLVLDEPTNHLDVASIEWLQAKLQTYPGALLVVTHDRYFLDEVTNRIGELDRGKLFLYEGNYTEYMVKKAEREAVEARTEHNRLRAIESELTWVRASAPARTTKQKARLKRFDEMVKNRPTVAGGDVRFRLPHPPRIGKTILTLRGVDKAFGERVLMRGLDLDLERGDRIGIVGDNGAGKTTLIKMIAGDLAPDAGDIEAGLNTRIVYADQARSDLDPENLVLTEVAGDDDKVYVGERAVQVQTFLDQLGFDGGMQRTKVGALSGGEKSRVSLAKALRVAANLVILDEPTNDLDLATLRTLEEALLEYPGCALIVSHDRYFLDRVATSILAFEGDGRVVLYRGGHQLYRDRLKARAEAEATAEPKPSKAVAPAATTAPGARPAAEPKARTRRTFKEQREFDAMETAIMEAEEAVEALEAETSDPERIRALGAGIADKLAELETARAAVETLYARWSALSELTPYGG